MKKVMIFFLLAMCLSTQSVKAQMLVKGVSKELAEHRKANISQVVYDLTFNIPSKPYESVKGKAIISFNLEVREDVVLDFQGQIDGSCYIHDENDKRHATDILYQDEHIIIPMELLTEGKNKIELPFIANDKALNRNDDYMYTLFVPDMARSVFPCFDQPDLRAVFVCLEPKWKRVQRINADDGEVLVVIGEINLWGFCVESKLA